MNENNHQNRNSYFIQTLEQTASYFHSSKFYISFNNGENKIQKELAQLQDNIVLELINPRIISTIAVNGSSVVKVIRRREL